jgi:hypothetical protein
MFKHSGLRLFAVALLVSGTFVSPAAAGPRGSLLADLTLDASAAPDPVASGAQVTVTFTVGNNGPDPGGAVVTTSTPDGTTFASATSSSADVAAPSPGATGTITATFSSHIQPSETAEVEIVFNVTADPGSALMFEGSVAAGPGVSDQGTNNNDATAVVEVAAGAGASADVAVEITPFADEAGSGALFTYDVDVTNASEGDDEIAQGVTVSIDVPEGAGFAEIDSDADECSTPKVGSSGTIICTFAEIAPGESFTTEVTVQVLAQPGHTFDFTASVESATDDPETGNNSAEASVDVVPSPPVMLDWDEPDDGAATDFPPPRNLVVEEEDGARTIARFEMAPRVGARRDTVMGYNVYGSTTPGVMPSPGSLLTSVPASQTSTMVPAAPSGTFFVVTATYAGGESAPSNEASGEVPAGTISSVKAKGAKVTVSGSSFSATVSVFVDGIPFVSPAKVKKAGTKVIQKGNLLTGQTVAVYLQSHPNVLVTVRNSNGGVAAFRYPN